MIFFESPYAKIHWSQDVLCVIGEWKKFASGESFRVPLEKGLELLAQKQASRWLADMRQMGPISQGDQDWHDTDWVPRLVEAGARYVAIVVPESAIAKMSMESISTTQTVSGSALTIHNFGNLEDAKAWLKK